MDTFLIVFLRFYGGARRISGDTKAEFQAIGDFFGISWQAAYLCSFLLLPSIVLLIMILIKWVPYYQMKLKLKKAVSRPLATEGVRWLNDLGFYTQLNHKDKIRFKERISWFIVYKDFIPKNGLKINELTKIKIAACAIQLTFGFKSYQLEHFQNIILFPNKFLSPFTKKMTLGEVTPYGAITISMNDFDFGYSIPDDGINVGLHEMAHALLLQHKKNASKYAFARKKDINHLFKVSKYAKKENTSFQLYRENAFQNFHEFFAHTIELFFEKHNELEEHFPLVFELIKKVLNQDSMNKALPS